MDLLCDFHCAKNLVEFVIGSGLVDVQKNGDNIAWCSVYHVEALKRTSNQACGDADVLATNLHYD